MRAAVCVMLLALLAASAHSTAQTGIDIRTPHTGEVVGGVVNITGTSTGAVYVQVRIDDGEWQLARGTDSWYLLWNTSGFADGPHTVYAKAFSGAGEAQDSVNVTVNNTPPEEIQLEVTVDPLKAQPGDTVRVSGIAEYDTRVKVKNAPVVIELSGTHTTSTDESGFFLTELQAPSEPGDYPVRVTVEAGNLSSTWETTLAVRSPSQPDLRMKDLQMSPQDAVSGDAVTFTAVAESLNGRTAECRVCIRVDGETLGCRNATVSTSASISVNWTARYGTHLAEAEIVSSDPPDLSEGNDNISLEFQVFRVPELSIVEVVLSNPRPEPDTCVTVSVHIRNSARVGDTCTVYLYDGDREVFHETVEVRANSTQQVYGTWKAASGPHRLCARITAEHMKDRSMCRDVYVRESSSGTQEAPGLELLAALSALALAVLHRRDF